MLDSTALEELQKSLCAKWYLDLLQFLLLPRCRLLQLENVSVYYRHAVGGSPPKLLKFIHRHIPHALPPHQKIRRIYVDPSNISNQKWDIRTLRVDSPGDAAALPRHLVC